MTDFAALGDVCEFIRDGTHGSPERAPRGVPVLSAEHVQDGGLSFTTDRFTTQAELDEFQRRLKPRPGDVLMTIVGTIGRVGVIADNRPFVFQRSVCVFRPKANILQSTYLKYALQSAPVQAQLRKATRAVAQAGVYLESLNEIRIPLPDFGQQERVATLLQSANQLHRSRRYALQLCDHFLPAAFNEAFGNDHQLWSRWDRKPLSELVVFDFRNGVSPSKTGRYDAEVLTLSAITGTTFDPRARKRSTFTVPIPADKEVSHLDFLVCRGNGNLHMVGTAQFPNQDLPGVAFPDTVIAARPDPKQINRHYLQALWRTATIRRQIESSARTTNGTYKINQDALGEVEVPLPPLDRQERFSFAAKGHSRLRGQHSEAQRQADHLFQTLLHQAFQQAA
jgi:type I restriction enzyme S subunit